MNSQNFSNIAEHVTPTPPVRRQWHRSEDNGDVQRVDHAPDSAAVTTAAPPNVHRRFGRTAANSAVDSCLAEVSPEWSWRIVVTHGHTTLDTDSADPG